ncbi:hypothetical protein H072_8146 [Dactylellina haptotyla CBS 200.50]|uniref:Uncharacterized protein n=1 Tax=Dactylellina haptotyla (strain CBS 200.50) TaxID=1284197 RepID=S8A501_DACHA|nr:hypothetical protein H072_8146 [Dactylellina haptotyla CBS 200.50]
MMRTVSAALLGLGTVVNAIALPQNSATAPSSVRPTGTNAPPAYTPSTDDLTSGCANVAAVAASFVRTSAAQSANDFRIDPKIGYDCLQSIPLDKEPALEFLFELSKFFQFQSTITYLARPPARSGQDPMDILGGLTDLYNSVESGSITQWNELETRVDRLLSGCHEGHLYVAWTLPSLINFRTPFTLVDLSPDGIQLSKPYVFNDVSAASARGSTFQASAITHIDGEEVYTAIQRLTYYEQSQSVDTRWNAAFQSQNPPKQGSFYFRTRYPGANTFTLTFENGTTTEYAYEAYAAHVPGSNVWSNLRTGRDIWTRLINIPPSSSSGSAKMLRKRALETAKKTRLQNGPLDDVFQMLEKRQGSNSVPPPSELVEFNKSFPDTPRVNPYIQDINQVVGGYFMDDYAGDGSRTAIIDITGFAPDDPSAQFAPHAVQAAVQMFLAEAKRRNMDKLIIDVRGNGGGYVNMGYDLYKQLFPPSDPYSGTRLRYHPASEKIAEAFTQLVNEDVINNLVRAIGGGMGQNLSTNQLNSYNLASYASLSNLDQFLNLDENGQPFTSFSDFIGPVNIYGGQFTNIITYNLNNLLAVGDLSYDITGYGDRASFRNNDPPFAAENIVLLTDGVCASTCGIFGEFLRNQQKIKTVVVGGRPNNEQSAAIGGTRGTQVIQHTAHMLNFVQIVENNFQPANDQERQQWDQIFPRAFKINIAEAAVNWKDNIRRTDPTQTPLQFYLEAADCRLFYTRDTLILSHNLWAQVDGLAWGADDACAVGSLKNATVVLGDSNGVPVSIGSTDTSGTNSGFGDTPQLTGDRTIDTGIWIWYGVRNSLGSSNGRRPY